MQKAKVLIYISSSFFSRKNKKWNQHSGINLRELAGVLSPILQKGHLLDFVSPQGKSFHIAESSYNLSNWDSVQQRDQAILSLNDIYKQGAMHPKSLASMVKTNVLDSYDALYILGGDVVFSDMVYQADSNSKKLNTDTASLLLHFHSGNKTIALMSQALACLLTLEKDTKTFPFANYSFAKAEKETMQWFPFWRKKTQSVYKPKIVDAELTNHFKNGVQSHLQDGDCVVCNELITTRHPHHAEKLAYLFIEAIEKQNRT